MKRLMEISKLFIVPLIFIGGMSISSDLMSSLWDKAKDTGKDAYDSTKDTVKDQSGGGGGSSSDKPPVDTVGSSNFSKVTTDGNGLFWAINSQGFVYRRSDVDPSSTPQGSAWRAVGGGMLLQSIAAGFSGGGPALIGITTAGRMVGRKTSSSDPAGDTGGWREMSAPANNLVQVAFAKSGIVWCVASDGKVYRSKSGVTTVNSNEWLTVNEPVRCVAVGNVGDVEVVWAINSEGNIFRRDRIDANNPAGRSWTMIMVVLLIFLLK